MIPLISNRKERIKDFFADSRKGFLLVWRASKRITIINIFLFLVQAVLPILSLVVLKQLIDIVVTAHKITWQLSGVYLLQFAALQLANVIATQFSAHYLLLQQQRISDDIAAQVLTKAIDLDLQYYENPSFYDELHMAQQQSLYKPAQLVTALQGIIQGLVSIALLSGFMLMVHWSVIILVILLGIPLAISKLFNGYKQFLQDKHFMPAQRQSADLFQYLTTDAYAKEVRIFDFGGRFIKKFLAIRQAIFAGKIDLQKKFLKQSIFIQGFEIIVTTCIYAIMIASAVAGVITIGGLVIYFQVFQRLQVAISGFFQSCISLFQNQLYLRQVLSYLSTPAIIREPSNPQVFPALQNGIQVKNLDFIYPDTSRQVLTNITMSCKPGEVTAIVGENGSGKSTLIKLLCKLYNATSGNILFDDIAVTEIDRTALRQNITAIFQDFGKYYLNIEENIALNEPEQNIDRLDYASKKAGIGEKIKTFPKGYKTMLGRTFKNGEQLSGGQWQKIALARGFYKNSKILILDEPTSAMDPIAEHAVFENLKNDIGDKIVILVTHRLYNLKMADRIYLLKDGVVAEQGTFAEMIAQNGAFANMYNKQAL